MSYEKLEALGRERLSRNFFMREFLYSEIAHWHQLRNIPLNPGGALGVGRELCSQLLEPLQRTFGRIHIRSGYRSPEVNAFGNKHNLNCATNEKNYSEHIWDIPDADGYYGAAACIVVPTLVDFIESGGSWSAMAWWIHDNLPYSSLCFFSKLGAFNIGWHQNPKRRIDSFAKPKGCLTQPTMPNHAGSHAHQYLDLLAFLDKGSDTPTNDDLSTSDGLVIDSPRSIADELPKADDEVGGGSVPVNYRAVHTKNAWRKAHGHGSIESAVFGPNGAAGLFAGKVRIDYSLHGEPLYVLVWKSGHPRGKLIRRASTTVERIEIVDIPVPHLERFDADRGVSPAELEKYFR